MIIVLKPLSPKEDIERVENMVKARGLDTHVIEGAEMTIIALQISKPRFPPGQLHHRCVRSQGWRR